jgi:hypothetical protein
MWKIVVLLLFMSIEILAQQSEEINIITKTGSDQIVQIEEIINIEFVNDELIFVTNSTSFSIPIDNIDNILFGPRTETNVHDLVEVDSDDVRISFLEDQLLINSESAIKSLYLIDITGKVLVSKKINSATQAQITLPHGNVFILLLDTNEGYFTRKLIIN